MRLGRKNKKATRVLSSKLRNSQTLNSKHSFELAISTLVVIVLAILILLVLSVSFTIGWGKFWTTTKGYFVSDVDTIVKICESVCNMNNEYDYCCVEREVDFGAGKEKVKCEDERLWKGKTILVKCDLSCEGVC